MNHLVRRAAILVCALASTTILSTAGSATTQVSISGKLTKDAGSPTMYGSADAVLPVAFSFVFDEAATTFLPQGTVFDTDNGFSFDTDYRIIQTSAISDFSFQVGGVTLGRSNLGQQSLGTSGNFAVLLQSGVANPIAQLMFAKNSIAEISFGERGCPSQQCEVARTGYGLSFQDGGYADLSDYVVTVSPVSAVPEAEMWISMIMGLGVVGGGLRTRRRLGQSKADELVAPVSKWRQRTV